MRSRLTLLIAAAAVAALMLIPSAASAATCPAGQEGTPPYCKIPPPPTFTVVSAGANTDGTDTVTLNVPGPGVLKISGKASKSFTVQVSKSGQITITIRPKGKVKRHLEHKGWTRPKLEYITFTAADGTTTRQTVLLRFRTKKHHS